MRSAAQRAALFVLVAAWLVAPLWMVRYPALLDYPDHLARTFNLVHLHDPAYHFTDCYRAEWGPYPYLGMDVPLIALQHVLGVETAGRLMLSLCVLALPMAAWCFLRKANPGQEWLALWALLVSYDSFFLFGFINFQLGIAMCLLALTAWLHYLERPGLGRWLVALAIVVGAYFTHLIAFGLAAFIAAVYGLAKRIPLKQQLASALLFLPGVALYFVSGIAASDGTGMEFRKLWEKLPAGRDALLHGFYPRLDLVLACAVVGAVIIAVARNRELHWNRAWLVVFAALLVLYLALPISMRKTWLIDVRVVPVAFLVLLAVGQFGRRQYALAALAIVLGALRVAGVAQGFASQQGQFAPMERAIQQIAPNAHLLPIVAVADEDFDDPLRRLYFHFWAYAVVERGACAPYLFDLPGQTALRTNEDRYIPDHPDETPPDWRQVQADYDYVWTYNLPQYSDPLAAIAREVYRSGPLQLWRVQR